MSAGEQMAESGKQKAGGVPEGWEYSSPEKLRSPERNALTIGPFGSNLLASDYTDSGVPLVFVREIRSRNFSLPTSKFVSQEKAEELRAHSVKPGDILITKMGDPPGDVAIYPNGPTAIITADCIKLTVDNSIANNCFVANALQTSEFRARLAEITSGVAQQKVSLERFRHLPILLPPLPEQRKIAAILSTWDDSLATLTNLLAAKRQQKRGLAEALLTGKTRLPGFAGEWEEKKLGDVLRQVKRSVEFDDSAIYEQITIKRRSGGIIFREPLLGSEILTKKMNVAHEGDFLISKMQVVHGASALVDKKAEGKYYSDSYVALIPTRENLLNMPYFAHLSAQEEMYAKYLKASYGVHIEKMTFNLELYLRDTIRIPSFAEQQAIASVLSTLDAEIASLEALKAKVQEQKRGLMDELLTGRIRVRVQE